MHWCLILFGLFSAVHSSPRIIEYPTDGSSSFIQLKRGDSANIAESQDVLPGPVNSPAAKDVAAQSDNTPPTVRTQLEGSNIIQPTRFPTDFPISVPPGLDLSSLSGLTGSPNLAGLGGLSGLPGSLASQIPPGINSATLEALKGLPNLQSLQANSNLASLLSGGTGIAGGLPPSFAGAFPTASSFTGLNSALTQNTGSSLMRILSSLGGQLGRSFGLSQLLGQNGIGGGAGGPPIPGLPALPGIGLPGRNFDIMGIVGALSRRAFTNSNISEVVEPNKLQEFSDNVTDTLTPELPEVDLSKYMGRWFEGVNSPKASDQRCIVHHYGGLTENGKTATFTALKIYRQGSEFGQVQYSIGYAFRGGRQSAMLQMHSSESQDATPYWIYLLGPEGKDEFGNPQYEYAVISNWIRYPIMVLVRDPDKFQKKYYVDVLRWLEDKGFINDFSRAFNLVQPVDYSNCQYEDSTFAAFG